MAGTLPAIRRWRQELWDHGYGWISGPPEFGGDGLPPSYARAFGRLTRQSRVPGDAALTLSLGMVAPAVGRHGTEQQKKVRCHGLQPPPDRPSAVQRHGAGSDLAANRTRPSATEGWQISSHNFWTSGPTWPTCGRMLLPNVRAVRGTAT